ncbi:MAG: TonB-dependent receptor [Acidobacteria bacterium]|nr:TonB-dependent receptor [Acidobacteriota bacterium]
MLRSLILATAAVVFCFSAAAQTATGILQGRVIDSTGAAVTDAKITIQNEKTGVSQTLATNSEGAFVLPFLIPGEYRLTVEKAGFQKDVTSGIRVAVQQTVALEITLKVGEVNTTVEVSASVAQLSTSTSSVSTVIENKRILDLPLNGRNPFSLANLTPGVIPGGGSTGWISGGRNASSEVTIDGTSIILPENNVSILQLAYTPSVDTIEEFSVITNSLAAEFGRTGGGVINVATRSGTNDFHGSAFEFLRNSRLDTNTWTNNRNGAKLASFQRNQFGGTFGGPVLIPRLYNGKNRSFFFFSEQSTRTRSQASATATVPIEPWLRGDFSDLRNGNGQLITVYDPQTAVDDGTGQSIFVRQPLPGNQVPSSRFNPVARSLLPYWPKANAVPVNQYTHQNNYFLQGKSQSREDKFDIRLDHNFSSKFKVWSRGSYGFSNNTPLNGFGNVGTSSGDGPGRTYNYNVAFNAVYTFNPTTILNFNYGFGRFNNERFPFSRGFDIRTLGFPQYMYDAASTQGLEFPRIDVSGNTNISSLGQATFTTLKNYPFSHNMRGDLTKVLSKHTLKFGGEYRKMFLNFTQLGQPDGQFTYAETYTRQRSNAPASTTAGNGFASLLLGVATGGTISHTFDAAMASTYGGFYVQDDWKVTRRLTFNLGLRYDVDLPHTERYNRLSYFDMDAPSPIAGKAPGFPNLKGAMKFVTPEHRRQVPTDKNNWGPRFGFAYRINEKTVFRGAYAMMYAGSVLQASGTSGSSGTEGFQSSTGMIVSTDGATVRNYVNNPFPTGFNLPSGSKEGPTSGASTNLGLGIGESLFNDWRNPVIQQWNGNLQRELGGGFVVEAGYLGSKGNHLPDGESSMQYNQLPASYFSLGNQLLGTNRVPNPFFGIIANPTSALGTQPTVQYTQLLRPWPQYTSMGAFRKPQANSVYHSFTLRVEKRFSKGLSTLISFTAGKLLDDASQAVTFLGQAGTKQDFYNRHGERAISSQDVSKRLVISGDYELPFGRNRKFLAAVPKAMDFVVGGWQVNGIATYQAGLPLAISNGGNNANVFSTGQRPNNNGKSPRLDGPIDQRLNRFFDTSVFSQAGNFTFGNVSRFSPDLRAPGTRSIDFSLFKNFPVRENMFVQLRGEAFNLSNTPQWGFPGTTVTAVSGFGVITSASGQRVIQLAMKLVF